MARYIAHWLRGLSGGGALDNVSEVLATRAQLDVQLASLEARYAPAVLGSPRLSGDAIAA